MISTYDYAIIYLVDARLYPIYLNRVCVDWLSND